MTTDKATSWSIDCGHWACPVIQQPASLCLLLMGWKLLVSLAMEGKFSAEGLQAAEEGEDILMAAARELVTEKGIGES